MSLLEAELFGSQTCSEPNSQQRLMKKSSRASFKSSATCSSQRNSEIACEGYHGPLSASPITRPQEPVGSARMPNT